MNIPDSNIIIHFTNIQQFLIKVLVVHHKLTELIIY